MLAALDPLRSAGYLSAYNDSAGFTSRPVTVIGTGNTPVWLVQAAEPRDAFYDAPIPALDTAFANITADVSPIASTAFSASFGEVRSGKLNDTQLDLLRSQVKTAHDKGIMVRYWDQPNWPIGTRNAVWRTLWDEGVDLLNVDDLKGVAEFWEGSG